MNKYDDVSVKGEKDMFGKKMGSGGGMRATDIVVWCGLCVFLLGVVGVLSVGGGGERVLEVSEEEFRVRSIVLKDWGDGQKQVMWGVSLSEGSE